MKHIKPWVGVLDKEFEKQIKPLHLKILGLQLTCNETPLQCVQIQLNSVKKAANVAFVWLSCLQSQVFPKDVQRYKREVAQHGAGSVTRPLFLLYSLESRQF